MRRVWRVLQLGLVAAAGLAACAQQPTSATQTTSGDAAQTAALRGRRIVAQRNASTVLAAPARQRLSTAQAGPARQQKPVTTLADAPVLNLDGSVVQLASAMPTGNWLLLYRTANCVSCDRLTHALVESGAVVRAAAKQVVVLQGNPHAPEQKASGRRVAQVRDQTTAVADAVSGLRTSRADTPQFSNAAWFYDRRGAVYRGLQAQGTPLLLGMRGNTIVWQRPGASVQPAEAQAMAASWVTAKTPDAAAGSVLGTATASAASASTAAVTDASAATSSIKNKGGRK